MGTSASGGCLISAWVFARGKGGDFGQSVASFANVRGSGKQIHGPPIRLTVAAQREGKTVMTDSLTIRHDQIGKQFEVTVEGSRAYLSYMDLGKQTIDIYRTFVPDALRGRGVAAALTEQALRYAEDQGYTVIPSCSYVERYMERRQRSVARQG